MTWQIWTVGGVFLAIILFELVARRSQRRHWDAVREVLVKEREADQLREYARNAIVVLMAKAKTASAFAESLYSTRTEEESMTELRRLYQQVVDHWIPDESDPILHELKASAARAVRSAAVTTLRVVH